MLGLISIIDIEHLRALLAKKNSATTPNFWHGFSRAPSDLQLCFVQLKTLAPSARYSTCKYTVTLKPGLGSLKVIEKYTIQCGTHDFLLAFHSHHRPISHSFRDKRRYPAKITNFPTPCIKRPRWRGSLWNLVSAQRVQNATMTGLPDGRKSFKIGLVVLIQYRLWHTASQPPNHVAVAKTPFTTSRG